MARSTDPIQALLDKIDYTLEEEARDRPRGTDRHGDIASGLMRGASARIRDLARENAHLSEMAAFRMAEVADLKRQVEDLRTQIALRDDEWARSLGVSQAWVDFRSKCLNHVHELRMTIRDLRRQVEEERSARVWHAKHSVRP